VIHEHHIQIFVDADACPVKPEVYRVANARMETPVFDWLELVVVGGRFDAADDWIAEHAGTDDIVISSDIPLAARCLKKGARVLAPTGRTFTDDNIGEALASRELMSTLRDQGTMTGGPAPFQKQDRSRFLHRLDETIHAIRRRRK
jgi:uncharacterized protein YaiI (UPF0178 family)